MSRCSFQGPSSAEACRTPAWATSDRCLIHRADTVNVLEAAYAVGAAFVVDLSHATVPPSIPAAVTELSVQHPGTLVSYQFTGTTFTGDAGFEGATFAGEAKFGGATFTGDARFGGTTFTGNTGFETTTFTGHAGFERARFRGSAWFDEATFTSTAEFDNTRFSRDAVFGGASFSGHAGFDDAWFSSVAEFDGATFASTVVLRRTTFVGDAAFDRVTFSGDAVFEGAAFTSAARFDGSTFTGDARFGSATFTGDVWFEVVSFTGDAVFGGATFTSVATFDGATFVSGTLDLDATGSGLVMLSNLQLARPLVVKLGAVPTSLRDSVIDQPVTFRPNRSGAGRLTEVRGCTLTRPVTIPPEASMTTTRFVGTVGLDQLRFVGDPRWPTARPGRFSRPRRCVADATDQREAPDLAQLEGLYRQLRASLEASKSHPGANDFYWQELECRRRRAGCGQFEWWLLGAYRVFLGYGIKALNPAIWWIALTALLASLFTFHTDRLLDPNPPGTSDEPAALPAVRDFPNSLAFVMQNATNVLRTIDSGLDWDGTLLLIAGRFLAVAFLAGTFWALRSRITR